MNWRKPIIFTLLKLTGSKIPSILKEIEQIDNSSKEETEAYQKDKLEKILLHAWQNVPYYTRVLEKAKVVVDGKVNLKNFDKISILTKDIIRKEGKNLYSKDYKERNYYENTSGGSTGEPVRFIQDKEYDLWNTATKIYFLKRLGKGLGESEIKFWGSDRDIIKGNLTLKDRITNFLYNRKFFNCYNFEEQKMGDLVNLNNSFKPKSYWAYVDGIYEFSRYCIKNSVKLYSPKFIVTTIGPLYEKNRAIIEKAFDCKTFNQYGSRELGVIAIENKINELNVFYWRQFIELLGKESEKKIIITSLDNYSMPLIRYEIGDVAETNPNYYIINKTKSFLTIGPVVGRTLGFFKTRSGLKHSHFIVQQLFFRGWIKKFQIIQKDYNLIMIKLVGKRNKEMNEIENKIKILMGKNCKIQWNFVKEIKPTKSGKYLYTVCEVK
ncbi:MAG: hypothetical protein BWY55_00198 [archaeon ADurb.Bin336]|nr:MAG: hypothetical protein BWY55_00198 [archaeon ADurb.Bin336]